MALASISVHGFAECSDAARAVAESLGAPALPVSVHVFPDGESLVTVPQPADIAVVYRPLHDPNAKLFEVALAASALRARGARAVVLLAPYLPYMRQDKAFATGQAVSQQVLGALVAQFFDGLVAVAPHLHRTSDLRSVVGGKPAISAQLVPAMAASLARSFGQGCLLLGPDEESEPLVHALADALGVPFAIGTKVRRGDRDVALVLDTEIEMRGLNAVLVDDMVSTGMTLVALAEAARARGVATIDAAICHALFGTQVEQRLHDAGVRAIRSCDGVPHATNEISLADSLASAVRVIASELA